MTARKAPGFTPERRATQTPFILILEARRREFSMPRDIIHSRDAPSSPFFSQAVCAAGLVFVSGQAPFDPTTGKIAGPSIQEQTRQCLTNVHAVLTAAGSSLDKIVSATVILAEEDDFAGMNEEWGKWFPIDPPARQGARLPVRTAGMRISIAVIAEM
jgi:2-iminobutanoate/2-iminopropanoate deaminase